MFEPGQDEIARRKAELRRQMQRRRKAVAPNDATAASILAARQAHRLDSFLSARVVALYCPIRGELDPLPWTNGPAAAGKRFVFPRTHVAQRLLTFHLAVNSETPPSAHGLRDAMVPGPYGILEPAGAEVPLGEIDLMVVPALAYGPRGARLGYGGGYYDRCLAAMPRDNPAHTVGLGYDWQIVDSVPAADHDWPVAAIVTPTGVAHCDTR